MQIQIAKAGAIPFTRRTIGRAGGRVRCGEVELFCRTRGEGSPLLLIMGLGVTSAGWQPQLASFGRRHRLITYDHRGCGRSDVPRPPYSVSRLAADARALLDALAIERAHVVGVSMGGLVAQALAAEAPDRVRSLVLACTFARMTFDMRMTVLEVSSRMLRAWLRPGGQHVGTLVAAGRERWEQLVFGPELDSPRARGARRLFEEVSGAHLLGLVGQAVSMLSYDATPLLPRIGAPTLVLGATRDLMVPHRATWELWRNLPNSRLEMIDGPHGVSWTNSREFNSAVLRHISAVDREEERSLEAAAELH